VPGTAPGAAPAAEPGAAGAAGGAGGRRSLALRIARGAAGAVGFVATLLGVIFVLWPSLKPEGPPPAKSATLTNATVDRNLTFGQYLDRIEQSRSSYQPADLRKRGAIVQFDYRIEGYKGKRLPLRWQLVDSRSGDQLAHSRDMRLIAEAGTDRGNWPQWIPIPAGRRPRRVFVQLQLYEPSGRFPLSRLRTPVFRGG